MAYLSIRSMNIALVAREQIADAYYQSMKPVKREVHYWHVERKAKRGKKWIFVSRFYVTKAEMAELWNKYYRGGGYRLVHMLKY